MGIMSIDFGMENVKAAYLESSDISMIDLKRSQGGDNAAPNVAYYERDDENSDISVYCLASKKVKEAAENNEDSYIRHVKRKLQQENWEKTLFNDEFTINSEKVAIDIFKEIINRAKGERMFEENVVITVPACFSEFQKMKLKDCAESAGFKVQNIVVEPLAALFSDDILDKFEDEDEKCVALMDFGGSTLDICIARISKSDDDTQVEILALSGINFGGADINQYIIEDILKPYYEKEISEKLNDGYPMERIYNQLFAEVEELKPEIYYEVGEDFEADIQYGGKKLEMNSSMIDEVLSNRKIDVQIKNLLEEMCDSVDEGLELSDVSEVFMIGGTARVSFFQNLVKKLFDDENIIDENLLEDNDIVYYSVAKGAINYVSNDIEICDVKPLYALGIDRGRGYEIILNKSNSYMEKGRRLTITNEFLNKSDWQINVYQSISDELRNNKAYDINNEDIYYAGKIKLNKDMYSDKDLEINMFYNDKDLIIATYQMDEDKMSVVENLVIG